MVQFWHCLGVPLGEVYGASETTGVATVNPPTAIRVGTAGTALSGVEVELSDGQDEAQPAELQPGLRLAAESGLDVMLSDAALDQGGVTRLLKPKATVRTLAGMARHPRSTARDAPVSRASSCASPPGLLSRRRPREIGGSAFEPGRRAGSSGG